MTGTLTIPEPEPVEERFIHTRDGGCLHCTPENEIIGKNDSRKDANGKLKKYAGYLKTPFAKMRRHGRFKIGPLNEKTGKYPKKPVDANGIPCDVKLFNETADAVIPTLKEDEILGFSIAGGIIDGEGDAATRVIALDYDDVLPPFENGYCERSVSGGGAHALIRIPYTGWIRETLDASGKGKHNIDYTCEGRSGHLEMFYTVQAVALTGDGKLYGIEAFTDGTRQADDILAIVHDLGKTAKPSFTGKIQSPSSAGKREKSGEWRHPPILTDKQFEEWNHRNNAVDILLRNGYEWTTQVDRLLYGKSTTGSAGVKIFPDGTVFSWHSDDPLSDGRPHDAYDCLRILECGGNYVKAAKQILRDLGRPTSIEEMKALQAPQGKPKASENGTVSEGDTPQTKKTKTLEEFAEEMVNLNGLGLKQDEDTKKITIDLPVWRRLWQEKTHVALNGDTKDGVFWYDGESWQKHPYERGFKAIMAKTLSQFAGIDRPDGWDNVREIAALRSGTVSYLPTGATSDYIYCTDGARISISAAGIEVAQGDPDRDVWLDTIGVSGAAIRRDLEKIDYSALLERYPNFAAMMEACDTQTDKDKGRTHDKMIATIAGSVFYSFFCKKQGLPPLDAVFWLYDYDVSQTGKSTHAGMIWGAFGRLATKVNFRELMSDNPRTGNLIGVNMVWADEASECKIQDTGLFKALPSGTASLHMLYHDPTDQTKPAVIVATANGAPRIDAQNLTDALKRRVIPYRYSIKHETTTTGCTDAEAYAAIINLGLWQCYRLMMQAKKGEPVRKAWLCPPTEGEIEMMINRVFWAPTLEKMLEICAGNDIPLSTLRRALVVKLVKEGRCDNIPIEDIMSAADDHLKDYDLPPELKTDNAFRNRLRYRWLKVKPANSDNCWDKPEPYQCAVPDLGSKYPKETRYVIRGVALRNPNDQIGMGERKTCKTLVDAAKGTNKKTVPTAQKTEVSNSTGATSEGQRAGNSAQLPLCEALKASPEYIEEPPNGTRYIDHELFTAIEKATEGNAADKMATIDLIKRGYIPPDVAKAVVSEFRTE